MSNSDYIFDETDVCDMCGCQIEFARLKSGLCPKCYKDELPEMEPPRREQQEAAEYWEGQR